eukprot:gb/GEZN01002134.1/.p1 GENE.gb/GEZN01002134.1/~~gb/GEZN01002134.1/.p1  ORF type:complete len:612 (+),score=79.17 gb/GEZN01002134.1/:25-1860(+)
MQSMLLGLLVLACTLSASSSSQVSKTAFQFSRRFRTCDQADRDIEEATTKLLWAYSPTDPVSPDQINYHGPNRGIASVRFFNDVVSPALPSDAESFELTLQQDRIEFKTGFQRDDTNYFCKAHKIHLTERRHIIRSEPIIAPGNAAYVHHFIVSVCNTVIPAEDLAHTGPCYDKANMPSSLYNCNSGFGDMLPAWAVGGGPYDLPDNIGFPVGPGDVYIVVETHFDNPNLYSILDSSGMRYWHTAQLRPIEAGSMFVGLDVDNRYEIPPGEQAYITEAWCTAECTDQFPEDGLHVFGAAMHTHTAGRAGKLRLVDVDGQELKPIIEEPYYDFNYQDVSSVNRTLHRGQTLITTCVYNTQDRSEPTIGGQATSEEMCLTYLFYYPRFAEGWNCVSMDYTNTVSPDLGKRQYCGKTDHDYSEVSFIEYVPPACLAKRPSAAALVPVFSSSPLDFSSYPSSVYLDSNQKFKMYWKVDLQEETVNIAIEVETKGWVGLGISPMGMVNADIVIGWVKDGMVFFEDRLATAQSMPRTDVSLGGTADVYDVTGTEYVTAVERAPLSDSQLFIIGIAGPVFLIAAGGLCCLRWRRPALQNEKSPLMYQSQDSQDVELRT